MKQFHVGVVSMVLSCKAAPATNARQALRSLFIRHHATRHVVAQLCSARHFFTYIIPTLVRLTISLSQELILNSELQTKRVPEIRSRNPAATEVLAVSSNVILFSTQSR